MIRRASLITFKKGTTEAQAAAALAKIADVLELPDTRHEYVPLVGKELAEARRETPEHKGQFVKGVDRPYRLTDAIDEFESDHGSPVFYVP